MFKNFHSLESKINLIFSISFLLLTILFIGALHYDNSKFQEENEEREREISHYIYSYFLYTGKIDEAYLEAQNISLIKDKTKVLQIELLFNSKVKGRKYAVETFHFKRVILINNDRFKLFLENKNKPPYPVKRIILFGLVYLLIFVLYFWIIKSLKPLSELKEKIKDFSKGNLNIDCKSNLKDEIAEVANEFDHAVKTIKELIQARQLFLRAIMHELKTPIGKGRLVAELIKENKYKERMHNIFERLNLLIDEFAKIEKITSKNFSLQVKPYKMSDLVEASIDMLMLEDTSKHINTILKKDYILKVDFELFTLIIKNLLDNGIKYSPNRKVRILIDSDKLIIVNEGKKLKAPIEEYFEPFHNSEKGLGLGIYIVKSILDIHKMSISYNYKYKYKENYFTINCQNKKVLSQNL